MQLRLAWLTPSSATDAIAEAVRRREGRAHRDRLRLRRGTEGRDRRVALACPASQDALIAAVAAANPRTAVVLNNGAPVLMPWVDQVAAILQMWYPGQEGADATMALIVGDASPGGRLPVTFPKRSRTCRRTRRSGIQASTVTASTRKGSTSVIGGTTRKHRAAVPVRSRAELHRLRVLQPQRDSAWRRLRCRVHVEERGHSRRAPRFRRSMSDARRRRRRRWPSAVSFSSNA